MQKITVDIVVPVYNEEKILEKNIMTLNEFLSNNFTYNWRIIIVNNASTDKTLEKAKELAAEIPNVQYLHLDQKGRGRALRKAWLESDADIVSYIDIDLSTDLSAFPILIDSIVKGYDLATGSRLIKGAQVVRSLKREILSRGYIILLKCFLGITFYDAQCGFKAARKKVIEKIIPLVKDNEWFFDSELLFKAQRQGYKIKEIPIKWVESPNSKVNIPKTVINYITSIIRLRGEFTKEFIYKIYHKPLISNIVRFILEAGEVTVIREIKKALNSQFDEKVLEVGCGTGNFSRLFSGFYVGFDYDLDHIKYAKKRFGGKQKSFLIMDASKIGFKDKSFAKAMLLSLLHHLPEDEIANVLEEISRVTKDKIIVLDLIPRKNDLVAKFFYKLDVGDFIRPLERQREILDTTFHIEKYLTFRSGVNTHSLFVCSPKD